MTSRTRRRPVLSLLFISLACAVFLVADPNDVIRPKRPQGARELQAALFVLRFQQLAELLCVAIAFVALVSYLRSNPGRGSRITAVAGTVMVLLCAAFSRVNIFEVMFHPAGAPSFQPVRETRLDGAEKVLAVGTGVTARAYPVRSVSYHHIVNDVAGGVPIAVTY